MRDKNGTEVRDKYQLIFSWSVPLYLFPLSCISKLLHTITKKTAQSYSYFSQLAQVPKERRVQEIWQPKTAALRWGQTPCIIIDRGNDYECKDRWRSEFFWMYSTCIARHVSLWVEHQPQSLLWNTRSRYLVKHSNRVIKTAASMHDLNAHRALPLLHWNRLNRSRKMQL